MQNFFFPAYLDRGILILIQLDLDGLQGLHVQHVVGVVLGKKSDSIYYILIYFGWFVEMYIKEIVNTQSVEEASRSYNSHEFQTLQFKKLK